MKALVIGTCFLMLCVAASADSYFGYGGYYGLSGYNGDNLWRTTVNWSASPAADGANTWIGDGYGYGAFGRDCIIDATTIAVDDYTNVGYQASSLGNLTMTGGSLTTSYLNLGNSGTGTFTMSNGTVIDQGQTRLGQSGGTGKLNINGGSFTTDAVWLYNGEINLYGGSLDISGFGFYGDFANMKFDIKGNGVFTWTGNHKGTLEYYADPSVGVIFTSGTGTIDISEADGLTTMKIVPEPATLTLLATGFALLARKRKN